MSRISTSRMQPRPCSGKKTLRRCRSRGETILIDVDSEDSDNIIDVDVPDYPEKNEFRENASKKKKKGFVEGVILIDDDETPEIQHSSVAAMNGSFSVDASSSRKVLRTNRKNSDATDKVPPFDQENVTPVKLSKGKRTYSGKASTRNNYGLSSDSEGATSENDQCSDCELMEDFSGKVQEQWEKAFSRRRKETRNCDSVEEKYQQHAKRGATRLRTKVQYSHSWKNLNVEAESPLFDGYDIFNDPVYDDFSVDSLYKAHYHRNNFSLNPQSGSQDNVVFVDAELEHDLDYEVGGSSRLFEESSEDPELSNAAHSHQSTKECDKRSSAFKDEETPAMEPCPPNLGTKFKDSCYEEISSLRDDAALPKCKANQGFHQSDFDDAGDVHPSKNFVGSRDEKLNGCYGENSPPNPEVPSSDSLCVSEPKLCQDDEKLIICQKGQGEDDCNQDEDALASPERCILGEREKHKETDEYKLAMEEEMASRQQALKIQAEEAQHLRRLRKREKAESMRLLDMERRQKQRVEEIRNTQKKDEENMNTKDVIRAEIHKGLTTLEVSCKTMACLLNCLGICVTGWPDPLPHEVQAAYKKALLTFHPDRSSRFDIRGQVEAEEKFKLVTRLKEKFLPSM